MGLLLVFLLQEHLPSPVQLLYRMHMGHTNLRNELVHALMEFFYFPFRFTGPGLCVQDADPKFRACLLQVPGRVLAPPVDTIPLS